jgi:F-type H+-transporting ATPase subunit b|tara:strand:- start:2264 stop:2818 length:555 start_codon:yes stop_codon:yes gene_type:complete
MELLLQSPILISGSFGINTDIFETNIINQIILLVGLYFVVGNALKESLAQRQAEINNAVTDSEKRLLEATDRLNEAKKQLAQAQLIIAGIKNRTRVTKITLLDSDYQKAKEELTRRFELATTTLTNRERLILSEIKQNISLLALKQVVARFDKQDFTSEKAQTIYSNQAIVMLTNRVKSAGEFL